MITLQIPYTTNHEQNERYLEIFTPDDPSDECVVRDGPSESDTVAVYAAGRWFRRDVAGWCTPKGQGPVIVRSRGRFFLDECDGRGLRHEANTALDAVRRYLGAT